MHHSFGLSPFPLTERRPSSTNKRPVAPPTSTPTTEETSAVSIDDASTVTDTAGGDQ